MLNLLLNKARILFFSMEMTTRQIYEKLASCYCGVNRESILAGNVTDAELSRLDNFCEIIKQSTFFVDDSSSLTISQLIARTKNVYYSSGVDVIFIDYLSLIRSDDSKTNRFEQVNQASQALRALAKELNVPIVCVCQLNRDCEKEEREPQMSDLSSSGQIEADAHVIVLMDKVEHLQKVNLIIAKNRFGPTGFVACDFHGSIGAFKEEELIFGKAKKR